MKILELPAYCYPEKAASSYLWNNLGEEYSKQGFERVLCAPTPCRGVTEEQRRIFKKRKEEFLYNGKLHIIRFPLFKEGRNVFLRAIRYLLSAVYQFFWAVSSRHTKSCQIIMVGSTPPIQGALAALVKKVLCIPFVYNLQDIFPDSLVGAGLAKKGGLIWKIGRVIENFTYRNADKIIVISEGFKCNILAKGVPEEKIEVIYNWVDEEAVVDIPRSENILFDRYGLDRNKFYITYNGNIGLTQNLDMLIEVAKELEHRTEADGQVYEDIHFVIIGEGIYKEKIEEMVKEQKIKNITLLPFQPYEDISHVFSLGDVSLVISKPEVGANSLPSKTWSIMSASRPVLVSFDENELKDIIEKNHCGIFTKAGDKEAFIDAILQLYNNRSLCKDLGRNGRKFIMENLTKEIGTKKYVDVIKCFDKTWAGGRVKVKPNYEVACELSKDDDYGRL